MRKRRTFTPEFKTAVVLEVLKEELSINEIAAKHEIAPNMLRNWKKEFLENSASIFEKKQDIQTKEEIAAYKKEIHELHSHIGRLTVDVDWLKKKSEEVIGPGWEEKSGFKKR